MLSSRRLCFPDRLTAVLGPVAMLLLIAGCGGSVDSPTDPDTPQSQAVIVSLAADTLWIGETVAFSATAQDSDGNQVASEPVNANETLLGIN